MNLQVYQSILQDNVRVAAHQLKLVGSCMEVNPCLNGFRKGKVFFWSRPVRPQTLTPLKRAGYTRQHPTNVSELKHFSKNKWSKIPPGKFACPIQSY